MTSPPSSQTRSLARSEALWERAQKVIPLGTQTLSKSPTQFVDGVSPKFLVRGAGARVWDADDNEYVDWPMALGPIMLGYDEPAVTAAVVEQVRAGTTFSLMHPLEVEVAELIVDMVPVRRAGALRQERRRRDERRDPGRARAHRPRARRSRPATTATTTGTSPPPSATTACRRHDRELIHAARLRATSRRSSAALDALPGAVAAVIVEVPGSEPPDGYLQARDRPGAPPRRACSCSTRSSPASATRSAARRSATASSPTCLPRQGHGQRLSARGRRRVSAEAMSAFERVFFSMTFSGETMSLAAARATLQILREQPVNERHLGDSAARCARGVAERAAAARASTSGWAARAVLDAGLRAVGGRRAVERAARPLHAGVPQARRAVRRADLPVLPPRRGRLRQTLDAVEAAFELMERAHAEGDYAGRLEGLPPQQVFRKHT